VQDERRAVDLGVLAGVERRAVGGGARRDEQARWGGI